MIREDKIANMIAAAVRDTVTAHGKIVEGSWAGSLAKRCAARIVSHVASQARGNMVPWDWYESMRREWEQEMLKRRELEKAIAEIKGF